MPLAMGKKTPLKSARLRTTTLVEESIRGLLTGADSSRQLLNLVLSLQKHFIMFNNLGPRCKTLQLSGNATLPAPHALNVCPLNERLDDQRLRQTRVRCNLFKKSLNVCLNHPYINVVTHPGSRQRRNDAVREINLKPGLQA